MLLDRGYDIQIFSTNIVKGAREKSGSFEICDKIKIHRFNPYFSIGENIKFWSFSSQLKKFNPDLIIAEVYRHPHTNLALKIAKQLKKPCFLVTHAPFVEPEFRGRFENLVADFYDRFYGKRMLKKFDRIIIITKWEIPFLLKLGINKDKLFYIPNGIPRQFFKPAKKANGLLFLGRISPVKNLEVLIEAINKIKERYKNIQLKIVGPSEETYKNKLLQLIKKLELENNIKFFPPVDELNKKIKIIDESDIFVLPSKREAMPQSLIEAMARGKIIIASNNKGASEIIKHKKNGFLFPVSDSNKLAEIIDFCLTKKNEKFLKNMRKNSQMDSKKFKWEKIFKDFYKLVKNLNLG